MEKRLIIIDNVVVACYAPGTFSNNEPIDRRYIDLPHDAEPTVGWTVNSNGEFDAPAEVAQEPVPHSVSKYTIIKRLEAAGKFSAALSVLKSDDFLYEKWSAVPVIHSYDQSARDLITDIGLDPDEILAKEI